ncbi:cAMP-dependent protein kinase type 1-like, partial [Galendromus occidentalis]|uniref:cAMP-dependent protein kinase type 1-like n=1 Tax=Galendromus occidentalis TaxID=34638 RepID=A0AAJ7SI38_9ACAR
MVIFTRAGRAKVIEDHKKALESAEAVFSDRYAKNECGKKDLAKFVIQNAVESGGFGVVFKAEMDGELYAIKRQRKEGNHTLFIREKKILYALSKSIFIVELFWTWKTRDYCYLIMDYAPYGDLYRIERIPHTEERVKLLLCQVVMGLQFIHASNVIFRDLKPANILVYERVYAKKPYTCAVDWWAFGITMFELMTAKGVSPFHPVGTSLDDVAKFTAENEPEGLDRFSDAAKDLLTKLLNKDPAQRLGSGLGGCDVIKKHEWFSGIDFD